MGLRGRSYEVGRSPPKVNCNVVVMKDLAVNSADPPNQSGAGISKSTPDSGTPQVQESYPTLRDLRTQAEIHAISRALEQTGWNRKQAARRLNISYRGLLYKIQQHRIRRIREETGQNNTSDYKVG